ncbi:MAG: 50S ribosomal protein L29 [Euzebyales bacterium]|nr:50S ribosomal protein L29 [Euzebyales bacterium]
MKAAELRELSDAELVEKFEEAKDELFNLRFANVTGQLDNVRRLIEVRKDIARVMTVQRERVGASLDEARSSQP